MAHEESSAHLADPDTDPLATYVLEPDDLRTLCARAVVGPGAGTATAYAPFTGAPVAAVPASGPDDVPAAAARARAAHRRWAAVPPRRRRAGLRAVHDLLLVRQSDALDLMQVETGLARSTASAELIGVAELARRLAGRDPSRERRHLDGSVARRRPAGVVAVIGAARAPLASTLGAALAPLLTGSAVLLHPDPQAVLVGLWVAELVEDAGLPVELLQVLTGGIEVGAAAVAVGDRLLVPSTATGRELAGLAGHLQVPVNRLAPGTVAAYVRPDAPVGATARALARMCFDGSPSAVRRVQVHRAVAVPFEEAFVQATQLLAVGPGLDYRAELGSLSTAAQLQQIGDLVAEAAGVGARVMTGGEPLVRSGPLFYAPTVLGDVPAGDPVRHEPVDGPLVVLDEVASDDEAVAAMNETGPMPRALVWTSAPRTCDLDVRADLLMVGTPRGSSGRSDVRMLVDQVTDPQTVLRRRGGVVPWSTGATRTALLMAASRARRALDER
ncbi:MAG: aldehyde dehydrogenase family protein [Actinobacteria bacterium]|nr:aldehyde dehydrogenase family protein [Actinomycetota bacterium]MCG2798656.1 aldehyde dehydrogenase family protein [Cellulomonas sp.]